MPIGLFTRSMRVRQLKADGGLKGERPIKVGFIKGKRIKDPGDLQKYRNKKVKYTMVPQFSVGMSKDNVKPPILVADITQVLD